MGNKIDDLMKTEDGQALRLAISTAAMAGLLASGAYRGMGEALVAERAAACADALLARLKSDADA